MIFLAKTNSTNGVLTMTEAQLAENAVKLREAECKFYKSIYPNIVCPNGMIVCCRSVTSRVVSLKVPFRHP